MKVIVYGVNFSPEMTGVGKFTGEMADWLSRSGAEVVVVTAPAYYPNWKVFPEFKWYKYSFSVGPFVGNVPGVNDACTLKVYRCPVWVPAKPSGLKRILHLLSFAVSSFPIMLRMVFWRPDVVWLAVPSLVCAPTALLVTMLSGSKSWIHIQDYELDAAFDLGMLRAGVFRRVALWFESILLRAFDRVSTISMRMMDRAVNKGVDPDRLLFFRNWVDVNTILPPPELTPAASRLNVSSYRSDLGIPEAAFVALYSGNMGAKQGLELLGDVAKLVAQRSRDDIWFIFCGEGFSKLDLIRQCEGVKNVRFLDLQPIEKLGELLATADVHLLPQRADAADLVMPSKLTGMLASGRPVIATAASDTELATVVGLCGLVVPPNDVEGFCFALERLADDEDLRLKLGSASREYAVHELDRSVVLSKFVQDLKTLSGKE